MMAMLFAQRVILGKTEFAAVPNKLKSQVADILVNGIPFVPQKFRNFPAILEHRKIQAHPL